MFIHVHMWCVCADVSVYVCAMYCMQVARAAGPFVTNHQGNPDGLLSQTPTSGDEGTGVSGREGGREGGWEEDDGGRGGGMEGLGSR